MAGALHDCIDFCVADQIVFGWSLKSVRAIFDAGGQAVVAGSADTSVIRHDDRADAARWILAPGGNVIGEQHESAVPLGMSIGI